MKPHSLLKSLSLHLLLLLLLFFLFFFSSLYNRELGGPWKAPFWPGDLLPLLPGRAALPVLLRSLRSAVDLLPTFVSAASSPDHGPNWKGACFYENRAWMEFHNHSGSPFGGGTLHIKVQKPDLLLLDEPLAGLDSKARADVVRLLKHLKELTILYDICLQVNPRIFSLWSRTLAYCVRRTMEFLELPCLL